MNFLGLSIDARHNINNMTNAVNAIIGIVTYPQTKNGEAEQETPSTEHVGSALGMACNK